MNKLPLNTNDSSHSNPMGDDRNQTHYVLETTGTPDEVILDNTDALKEYESPLNLSEDENGIDSMRSLKNAVYAIQSQLYSLKCAFEKHRTEYSKTFKDLVNKHDIGSTSIHKPQFDNLNRENQLLKDENKALNERRDNLGFILADLNPKVKLAEEEGKPNNHYSFTSTRSY